MRDSEVETASDATTNVVTLYSHVETQSERLMRLSNVCADVLVSVSLGESRGVPLETVAEMADVLARLSRVALAVETLSNFEPSDA